MIALRWALDTLGENSSSSEDRDVPLKNGRATYQKHVYQERDQIKFCSIQELGGSFQSFLLQLLPLFLVGMCSGLPIRFHNREGICLCLPGTFSKLNLSHALFFCADFYFLNLWWRDFLEIVWSSSNKSKFKCRFKFLTICHPGFLYVAAN